MKICGTKLASLGNMIVSWLMSRVLRDFSQLIEVGQGRFEKDRALASCRCVAHKKKRQTLRQRHRRFINISIATKQREREGERGRRRERERERERVISRQALPWRQEMFALLREWHEQTSVNFTALFEYEDTAKVGQRLASYLTPSGE